MSTEYKRIRDYELMVIFHPELSEEDLVSESGKVEEHITGVSGEIRLVNREAPWGRRRLAYPIRNGSRDIRDGVYVLYYFSAESGQIEEIEREIKLQDRIIRYLLTQQTVPTMEPAPAEGEGEEGGETEIAAAPEADSTATGAPVEGAPTETAATADTTSEEPTPAPAEAGTESETPAEVDAESESPAEADAESETPAEADAESETPA
jgi:small subunit ribosomal protein S6